MTLTRSLDERILAIIETACANGGPAPTLGAIAHAAGCKWERALEGVERLELLGCIHTVRRKAGRKKSQLPVRYHAPRLGKWTGDARTAPSGARHGAAPRDAKMRPCITCSAAFASEGVHNRMCPKCRAAHSGGESAYELHQTTGGPAR